MNVTAYPPITLVGRTRAGQYLAAHTQRDLNGELPYRAALIKECHADAAQACEWRYFVAE